MSTINQVKNQKRISATAARNHYYRKEFDMAIVGWVFVGLLALFAMAGVVIGLISIPDARRYLKIRHM